MSDLGLADYPARGLQLLAFSLAPGGLSPDPAPVAAAQGALALVAMVALAAAAIRFSQRVGGKLAKGAAALTIASVLAALASAWWFSGARGPLGTAARYVAPLWWASLTLTAVAAAHRLLGDRVRVRGAGIAGCLVVILGAWQLLRARPLLASPEQMWRRAIELEPSHDGALMQLSTALVSRGEHQPIADLADRCLAEERQRCGCHGLRIMALGRLGRADEAVALGQAVLESCGDHPLVRASHAHALARAGHPHQALERAHGGSEGGSGALVEVERRHARTLALEATGRIEEALAEGQRAIEAGGGRDARMLLAAVAINAGKLDLASQQVEALLAEHRDDPDALYNRALIAHRRDDYNAAREGYLATLREAPGYAAARYNLAVLTWHRGVKPEARHHAELFVRDHPHDPRGAALKALTEGAGDQPTPTWVGVPRPSGGGGGEPRAPPP